MKHMKFLFLIFSLSLMTFSQVKADEVFRDGQIIKANVENCKPGFYGALGINTNTGIVDHESNSKGRYSFSKSVIARCLPKTCVYRYYYKFGQPDSVITLMPDNKKIAEASGKEETKEVLKKLVADGVCSQIKAHAYSM